MRTTRRAFAAAVGLAAVAAVTGFAAAAHAAEGTVVSAQNAVAGSYIVTLKDTAGMPDGAASVARRHGATVTHVYRTALRGFSATMSDQQARRLAADPRVARVEQDAEVRALAPPVKSWGLDRIDQRSLPLDRRYVYPTTSSGVTAYVIDTGIFAGHSDFKGRASVGTDTVGDGQNGNDCHGHGTHVAGTVGGAAYGVAKGVSLVGVRVLNCNGSGTFAGVIAGVDWVTANAVKPAVANMSLGGGANQSVDDAVTRSIASGVSYAVAAGNSNANACNFSPARTPAAITVGATDRTDARAGFSNV
ncbi:MAG: S8 family serine peptidase, partial [Micromonosporaceae bacterium]|nr:S8 family serine peptidase [Micromonosporaceae bacterium]